MVAIITGQGLGVERGSGYVLGSRGQLGNASFGTNGDNVTVNAATGNLNITRVDDIEIAAESPDKNAVRTYNSMGAAIDDNHDNWSIGNGRTITTVTGTIDTAGSTVTRMDWDGSDTLYTYDTTSGKYIGKQGDGPYDTLSFNSPAGTWTWTDGSTQTTELYTVAVNPNNMADTYWATLTNTTLPDGNQALYFWSGNKITAIDSVGEWINFTYAGNNLTKISQTLAGGTIVTNVYYGYDAQNRLTSVTTDLSPGDNATADNSVVTTSYAYVGTTDDVASITQWAGWAGTGTQTGLLEIFYDASNRVASYRQTLSSGVTATTTLTYVSSTQTTVADAYGNVTTLTYDGNKQLTGIDYPAMSAGTPSVRFAYDANGNVTSATDAAGNATTYGYDTSGNMLWQRSPTGDSPGRITSGAIPTPAAPDPRPPCPSPRAMPMTAPAASTTRSAARARSPSTIGTSMA
jgi:YD repeat-containing protein